MSLIKAGKIQSGISLTAANNFILDASADDGSLVIKRASGTSILTVSASGVVDINGSGAPYGKDNLIGTVSQSGGVPTGGVIEQGSNANGHYTKFADGTLIVRLETSTSSAGYLGWNYPVVFVGNLNASCAVYNADGVVSLTSLSLTSLAYACKGFSGATITASISMTLIGSWY